MSILGKGVREADLGKDGYLADHRVQGLTTLPGAVYLDMVLDAAGDAIGSRPRVLHAVQFKNALFLSEDAPQRLEIRYLSGGDGGATAEIVGEGGTVHAEMTAAPGGADALNGSRNALAARLDVAAEKDAASALVAGEAFYEALDGRGNQYGPAFRVIETVWPRDGAALAALTAASNAGRGSAGALHPTVIDAGLQAISATHEVEARQSYVITEISRFALAEGARPAAWALATLVRDDRAEGGDVIGDVTLFDADGAAVAALDGVHLRYIDHDSAAPEATIAVAATFTAEPLEDSLTFWSDELGARWDVAFAPYNQIFQELLDPDSTFSANKDGLNVALIRFDDWLGQASAVETKVDAAERARILEDVKRHTLPNGLEIAHLNPYETDYVYNEIFVDRCYMKGGVTLRDGDVVFDIGANIGLFTLFVTSEVRDATIFSFEPSPQTFACLKANAALYGAKVTPINQGVSDAVRTATFTHYENSSVFSGFRTDENRDQAAIRAIVANMVRESGRVEGAELEAVVDELMDGRLESSEFECRLTPVSEVIRTHGVEKIDLLKIDAEGSELDVLNGVDPEHWALIRQIAIEVHDREGPLVKAVCDRLRGHGFELEIIEEELLHDSGLYNIFATRPGDARAADEKASASPDEIITRNAADLRAAIDVAAQRSRTPLLVMTCPPRASFDVALAERRLAEALDGATNCRLLPYAAWSQPYPVAEIDDPDADRLGHIPYTQPFFAAMGSAVARAYAAATRPPFKVLALDCDNTIWRGVCGEDGPTGVSADGPYRRVQEFAAKLAAEGVLLALVSKNAAEDVKAVFDAQPGMPLKFDDAVGHRINWEPKPANIKSLAVELNLGLDAFVFLDDNAVECAEMRAALPEVLTLQLPADPEAIPAFLDNIWAFDRAKATAEDKKRSDHYRQEKKRTALRETTMTLTEFLDSLGLVIDIRPPEAGDIPRVSQMTHRTNQFNFTTLRRSEADIAAFLADPAQGALIVSVRDRFGDYGVVGLALHRAAGDRLEVDTFLMSCRVLGRGVEYKLMAQLGEIARRTGLATVVAPFQRTAKNEPALKFLERAIPSFGQDLGDGARRYLIPAEACAQLAYRPEEGDDRLPSDGAAGPKTSGVRAGSEQAQRIAAELAGVEAIWAAMAAKRATKAAAAIDIPGASALERDIAKIWVDVLGLDRIGLEDRYTEIGGTSLRAVQVVARMKRECGVEMSLVDLYENPTIAMLARRFSPEGREAAAQDAQSGRERGERRRNRLSALRQRRAPSTAG